MLALVGEAKSYSGEPNPQVIHRERKWFEGVSGVADTAEQPRISASRWVGHAAEWCEQESEIEAGCHVVGITLQPMSDITLFAAGKLISTGHLPRGSMRVNEPGLPRRGIFRGAYDVLHLHVPNGIIAEFADPERGYARSAPVLAESPTIDPVIEGLARSLIHAEELGGAFGQSYAEGIGLAITAQLFGARSGTASSGRPRVSGLSKWRLKRATEYMDANLAEPINLADIAAAAGLSRMHFAAQFRAATGVRPHEFLLQRRIERAKDLLLHSRLALVEIALDVGFKTQAHFTTVFARFVNETPNVWRQRNRGISEEPALKAA
jgi:AraC family transcriptional regulator